MEVDGIRLDPNNEEFMEALALAQATDKNLYITGKAGSGKTFFLKYLEVKRSIPSSVWLPLCMSRTTNVSQTSSKQTMWKRPVSLTIIPSAERKPGL